MWLGDLGDVSVIASLTLFRPYKFNCLPLLAINNYVKILVHS